MTLEYELLEKFRDLNFQFGWTQNSVMMGNLNVISELRENINESQLLDEELQVMSTQPGFTQAMDGVLSFNQRICVLKDMELRRRVLEEAHKNVFTIHPGSSKMYQDLKKNYWHSGMKKNIAEYVFECVVCQQVRIEH